MVCLIVMQSFFKSWHLTEVLFYLIHKQILISNVTIIILYMKMFPVPLRSTSFHFGFLHVQCRAIFHHFVFAMLPQSCFHYYASAISFTIKVEFVIEVEKERVDRIRTRATQTLCACANFRPGRLPII